MIRFKAVEGPLTALRESVNGDGPFMRKIMPAS
jgi:hypothetical protein